jgi:hypothetical protein
VKGSVEHNYEPVDKRAKEILQKTGSQIKPMLVLSMARGPNKNEIIAQWTQNLIVRMHLTIYYRG